MSKEFMFDTNLFGDLIDSEIDDISLQKVKDNKDRATFYVTHVQLDELNENEDEEARGRLLDAFTELMDEKISTEDFVWGVSRWNRAKWGEGNLYENIKKKLPGDSKNNWRDGVIASTAIKNNITLVTADGEGSKRGLQDILEELDKTYMTRKDFIRWLDNE